MKERRGDEGWKGGEGDQERERARERESEKKGEKAPQFTSARSCQSDGAEVSLDRGNDVLLKRHLGMRGPAKGGWWRRKGQGRRQRREEKGGRGERKEKKSQT